MCVCVAESGRLITRLELHRSMVTCVAVNGGDDVFASASTDRSVAICSLQHFCLLNQLLLDRPVMHMDLSCDSTFLALSTDDNCIHVHALTTGSQIYCIQASKIINNLKGY